MELFLQSLSPIDQNNRIKIAIRTEMFLNKYYGITGLLRWIRVMSRQVNQKNSIVIDRIGAEVALKR